MNPETALTSVPNTSSTTDRNNSLNTLPFFSITNIEILSELQTTTSRLRQQLEQCNLNEYLFNNLPMEICENIDCRFYNELSFNQLLKKCSPEISLMHLNIRSLNKHRSKLTTFLDTLNIEFDIIALTEIGKNNTDNNLAFFENYQTFYESPRTNFGGTCILAKNKFSINERADLKMSSNTSETKIEDTWLELNEEDSNNNLILGVVYRHPNTPIENFNKEITKTIEKIKTKNKNIIICGDFNINMLSNNHEHTNNFKETMLGNNYIPTITLPTRITDSTATLIDNIFLHIDNHNLQKECISGNFFCDISDHLPNFLLYGNKSTTKNNVRPLIRIYSDNNMRKFNNTLANTDWSDTYTKEDTNEAYNHFITTYLKAFNLCFPLVRQSKKRAKDKKWVTTGIKTSSTHKNHLYKLYLKKPTEHRKEKYIKYKNTFTHICRLAEEKFYFEILSDKKASIQKLWQIMGPIITPQKTKSHTTSKN